MSNLRKFLAFTLIIFVSIGVLSLFKREKKEEIVTRHPVQKKTYEMQVTPTPAPKKEELRSNEEVKKRLEVRADRIRRFFSRGMDKFPIVETITYTSRVPWLKGRPAWVADYASHYETSRHFIARSLNGRLDYETQRVSPGDKFNVLRKDKNVEFYLLVDLSTCTMDFYYLDKDLDERVFVKRYEVGVGREDPLSPSGSLTPVGKYMLGNKVAIYKPGIENFYQNRKTHMIEIFGTRWMPFAQELENCSDSAKGYGFHGVPCFFDEGAQMWIEENSGVGKRNSDGCLRLKKDDVEELFAIVITKPTIVEIVKDRSNVALPMSVENQLD